MIDNVIDNDSSWSQVKQCLEGALTDDEVKTFVKFWARQYDSIAYEYAAGIVYMECKDILSYKSTRWIDFFWNIIFSLYAQCKLAWHSAAELRVWYDLHMSLSENDL